jgi:deoxyribonuclease-1-like protein
MQEYIKLVLTILVLLFPFNSTGQNISIISWNIQDFGQTKDDDEILAIAKIIKDYDIVAIQEVVAIHPGGAKAVARLADQLNRLGNKWDYRLSDPTQSPGKRTERYAFFWKTNKVRLIGKPWLDKTFEPVIYREPYLARFKVGDKQILVANYHSRSYRDHPEEEIICFNRYSQLFSNDRIVIAGDFNTPCSSKVFNSLREAGFVFNLEGQKTTMKRKCGKGGAYLNHPIDFILIESSDLKVEDSGFIDFVDDCELLKVKRKISDHLPVWVKVAMK